MDSRIAVTGLSSVAILLWAFCLVHVGPTSGQAPPTFRSALLTKTHTAAPTPPLRECPCSSDPCHHGGECTDVRTGVGSAAVSSFVCECVDEWEGDVCHICNDTLGYVIQCSNICSTRRNGKCEDGGHGSVTPSLCNLGTDCADCHQRCV